MKIQYNHKVSLLWPGGLMVSCTILWIQLLHKVDSGQPIAELRQWVDDHITQPLWMAANWPAGGQKKQAEVDTFSNMEILKKMPWSSGLHFLASCRFSEMFSNFHFKGLRADPNTRLSNSTVEWSLRSEFNWSCPICQPQKCIKILCCDFQDAV